MIHAKPSHPEWATRSYTRVGHFILRAFDTQQLQALVYTFLSVHADGYQIGLVFFGLGSTAFAYLRFKSRCISRGLAAWGISSSLVVAIVTLVIMVFPSLVAAVIPVYFAPIFIFEVTLVFWLLVKGIQALSVEQRPPLR